MVTTAIMTKEKNLITTKRHDTPCGTLLLGTLDDRLCLCDWQTEKHREFIVRRLSERLQAGFCEGTSPTIEETERQIDEYFAGKRSTFDIPIIHAGTEFQEKVWAELMNIPYGTTISYACLARRIGRPTAVRAAANANRTNPISIIVPCHRVIGSNGTLTGYGGGMKVKAALLKLESAGKDDLTGIKT